MKNSKKHIFKNIIAGPGFKGLYSNTPDSKKPPQKGENVVSPSGGVKPLPPTGTEGGVFFKTSAPKEQALKQESTKTHNIIANKGWFKGQTKDRSGKEQNPLNKPSPQEAFVEGGPKPSPWKDFLPLISSGAAACLLLIVAPLLPRYFDNSEARGIASFPGCPPQDFRCKREVRKKCKNSTNQNCEAEVWMQLQSKRKRKQQFKERRTMHMIHTGHRKIASIGSSPTLLEVFSFEVLKSRYKVKSLSSRKLDSVEIREGEIPLVLPRLPVLIKNFSSLFPAHHKIKKQNPVLPGTVVYALLDKTDQTVSMVEVTKDSEGRLLSLHLKKEF